MNGSRIRSIRVGSGRLLGLSTVSVSPDLHSTRYSTVGAVVIRSIPYSPESRSRTTSMCKSPRNPQRKPKPSAGEDSVSKCSAASFKDSRSIAWRSSGKSAPSSGYSPANTAGLISRKPGNGSAAGARAEVRVSPTRADCVSFKPITTKPTAPAGRVSTAVALGVNTPICSAVQSRPLESNTNGSLPPLSVPSTTRTRPVTPR